MKSVEDRLRELPEDAGLKAITADDKLRRRILEAAKDKKAEHRLPVRWIAAGAACAAAVAALAFTLPRNVQKAPQAMLTSQSAGEKVMLAKTEEQDEAPLAGARESAVADVPQGMVFISNASAPESRSLWVQGNGANFPLVAVQGKYFRMLASPSEVSHGLLGEELGTVAEYTQEPALSGAETVSNICPEGTVIYALRGASGLAAAEVNGRMRLFQRVSFAGRGLVGSEHLSDTLGGRVSAMELSGVGRLTGSAAEEMWSYLCAGAVYLNASCAETGRNLLVTLDNGLTFQMAVSGDTLSACGAWACPGFAEAFANAL
ncbi:MAG: hypothetical protein IKP22_09840 [Clostridia bacterium]|nr:hypothetical protein [Clostridia bacterium]